MTKQANMHSEGAEARPLTHSLQACLQDCVFDTACDSVDWEWVLLLFNNDNNYILPSRHFCHNDSIITLQLLTYPVLRGSVLAPHKWLWWDAQVQWLCWSLWDNLWLSLRQRDYYSVFSVGDYEEMKTNGRPHISIVYKINACRNLVLV